MVYRVFVEKKPGLRAEADALFHEGVALLGLQKLTGVRIIQRYDVEGLSDVLFEQAVRQVFSEPQVDQVTTQCDLEGATAFAVEYLPGQFDQRADSAAQCIQIITQGERPLIRSAKIVALYGELSSEEVEKIKKYVINPVEAREAGFDLPETLKADYGVPTEVPVLEDFCDLDPEGLKTFIADYGLAMDADDIVFCQAHFREIHRAPTLTEIRLIDTYWSDHCRHTTFSTIIDEVVFEDDLLQKAYEDYCSVRQSLGRIKPICLMDLATIAVKYLKAQGKLDRLDESEEINACTVKIDVTVDGKKEPWLLLFKNETHNHPTEIEPFGGAATCVGGAIRDPLSGRGYVYGAMRLTGASDPRVPVDQTIPGKLPQRKIVTTAASGYSSYGNQIGLATGIVDELYHPGYAAKHMEIGAVIAATPEKNVRREVPEPGDLVILLGGKTGRDGIGGATGASKAHTVNSVETCGAEVQKGNAPEERKLQRLFRNPKASTMIKRCNDFGAGGVSVAIGELASGLRIDLNAVPKKYEGLDGTELAISESQERMAVVIEAKDRDAFLTLAHEENCEATPVAVVTEEPRLVMTWNGRTIVDLSRDFLDSNGAEKHIRIVSAKPEAFDKVIPASFEEGFKAVASDLNTCSKRGLSERFDSTIGAGTVLMPFGGKNQLTPIQAMVHKISLETGDTEDCSLMSWGCDPMILEKSPYHGAYLAVVESLSKLLATGADLNETYLSFQEYFEKLGQDPKRWGKPLAALLGAFEAQKDFGVAAIGGKDSMSGSFEDLDVPPTFVSFAVTTAKIGDIISPEFKQSGSRVWLVAPDLDENGLPNIKSQLQVFEMISQVLKGQMLSCYTLGKGGVAEAVLKMALGNGFGFQFEDDLALETLFGLRYGAFVVESEIDIPGAVLLGRVTDEPSFIYQKTQLDFKAMFSLYEDTLEAIYPCHTSSEDGPVETFTRSDEVSTVSAIKSARPKVLIPVFPGTNCEYDSAKAVTAAGADPELIVINNLSAQDIARSVDRFAEALKTAEMIFIPGGFSGGDEPDGSGKFITAFFRSPAVKEGVTHLLDHRNGLICGICNGFQALIKLGLVPYGKIIDPKENSPTLTFNTIGRHQSKIVRTRVVSNRSPWLSLMNPGEIVAVPISHGEGRLLADEATIRALAEKGQIATQYVNLEGEATMDLQFNPNGSAFAIEGLTSPDGRIFGKMGHSERVGKGLYKNVPGNYDLRMFEAAVRYFK